MSIGPQEWADYGEEPPPPVVMRGPPDLVDLMVLGFVLLLFCVVGYIATGATWPRGW